MQELWFLCFACCLMLIDIYMMFCEDSLIGFQVIERTWFCDNLFVLRFYGPVNPVGHVERGQFT